MRNRTYLVLWFIVVFLGGSLGHALDLLGKPEVKVTASTATITWKTDVACGTKLQYGRNAAQLDQKAEGVVGGSHEISLANLTPGTTYHYSLGSARQQLATGTFTTAGAAPTAAPPPSTAKRSLPTATSTPAAAPPARQTWGNLSTLQDHYDRHGPDFNSQSPEDYAAKAWHFLQHARVKNLPMKLDDTDKTLRIYDPSTGAFAAYNAQGRTKTYFKPGSPGYWQRQPGRPVKSTDLPFSQPRP